MACVRLRKPRPWQTDAQNLDADSEFHKNRGHEQTEDKRHDAGTEEERRDDRLDDEIQKKEFLSLTKSNMKSLLDL
jgi:hypothetical protein